MTTFTTNITAMYTVNTHYPQYVVNVLWEVVWATIAEACHIPTEIVSIIRGV